MGSHNLGLLVTARSGRNSPNSESSDAGSVVNSSRGVDNRGRLVNGLLRRLVGGLLRWLVGGLLRWLISRLVGWLGGLVYRLVYRLGYSSRSGRLRSRSTDQGQLQEVGTTGCKVNYTE